MRIRHHGRMNPGFNMVAMITTDGQQLNLYDLHSNTPMTNVAGQHPEVVLKMKGLTEGIYRTTQYMAYHNKRRDN